MTQGGRGSLVRRVEGFFESGGFLRRARALLLLFGMLYAVSLGAGILGPSAGTERLLSSGALATFTVRWLWVYRRGAASVLGDALDACLLVVLASGAAHPLDLLPLFLIRLSFSSISGTCLQVPLRVALYAMSFVASVWWADTPTTPIQVLQTVVGLALTGCTTHVLQLAGTASSRAQQRRSIWNSRASLKGPRQ